MSGSRYSITCAPFLLTLSFYAKEQAAKRLATDFSFTHRSFRLLSRPWNIPWLGIHSIVQYLKPFFLIEPFQTYSVPKPGAGPGFFSYHVSHMSRTIRSLGNSFEWMGHRPVCLAIDLWWKRENILNLRWGWFILFMSQGKVGAEAKIVRRKCYRFDIV